MLWIPKWWQWAAEWSEKRLLGEIKGTGLEAEDQLPW